MSPADIRANLESLQKRIAAACQRAGRSPSEVTLIAVSKTVEVDTMLAAYHLGIRHFGENRVQEAHRKFPSLGLLTPPPTRHLIGHLQSNKVKAALAHFDIIHSVDSVELAQAISRRATCRFPALLEVNVGGEASKSGFTSEAVFSALKIIARLPNLEIKGLMTVAPIAAEAEEVRPIFQRLRQLKNEMGLKDLSMGMTDDFEVAIEEGATIIRVGRGIFGERG